jgi:hypothetical protein
VTGWSLGYVVDEFGGTKPLQLRGGRGKRKGGCGLRSVCWAVLLCIFVVVIYFPRSLNIYIREILLFTTGFTSPFNISMKLAIIETLGITNIIPLHPHTLPAVSPP